MKMNYFLHTLLIALLFFSFQNAYGANQGFQKLDELEEGGRQQQ